MPNAELWAGALSLMVRYAETGCVQSGRQAACVLERIAAMPELDHDTSALLERAHARLLRQMQSGAATCR